MKLILFFLLSIVVFSVTLFAQNTDSVIVQTDSLKLSALVDSVIPAVLPNPVFKLKNKLLNSDAEPVSLSVQFKKVKNKNSIFYLIAGIVLLFAFFKYFNSRYFTNLFKVFFNASLRQNQITDQLLQAKLPSLLFNFFFIICAGVYVYILLLNFGLINEDNNIWIMILSSISILGVIYIIKYCILKFTGWVTGLKEVTNTYVFIVFLINKIMGIFLLPFIVVLFFSDSVIANMAAIISLMSIGIFFLLRYFRSYGLLQNQLKVSHFHFILFITGIELLPLLLIYKALMVFLSKNL